MNSYRDLIDWQKSISLVKLVYELTNSFPDNEDSCLTSQIRRSGISVPSNIAEGYGRHYVNDYVKFLQISRGSLYELQTQFEIASMLGYISEGDQEILFKSTIEIEKMLNSLINKLNSKNNN